MVEKSIPPPGPNDAVIKTTASLICTSDVHIVHGVIPFPEGRVLGHESVGIVHQCGRNVRRCREGDRVAVNASTPCGHCDDCQRGAPAQCGGYLGALKCVRARWQPRGILPRQRCRLQPGADSERLERRTGALHHGHVGDGLAGAENAVIAPGATVAVFAQGPVGLSAIMMARLLGAGLSSPLNRDPTARPLHAPSGLTS